jgi:hypothetical protein
VSRFSAQWLFLREPYDLAARNDDVLDALGQEFRDRAAVSVVDLACGTGATVRAIARCLPAQQSWRLVDNDLGLLARVSTQRPGQVSKPTLTDAPEHKLLSVVTRPVDLVCDLELALEAPLDLVATSALLDLVSPEWLDRLIIETAARDLPLYAALSYDGRVALEPAGEFDTQVLAAFDLHQQTDKGFGPALGPAAAARAVERLEHFGFAVEQGRSDWVLGPADQAMQEALLVGWAEVAGLMLSDADIAKWLAWRRREVAAGRSRLRVGHVDIFARPIRRR